MISTRLHQFINYKKTPITVFEAEIGVSKGAINTPIKKNKTIGADIMMKIFIKYPELNIDWLVTGRGKMLNGNSTFLIDENFNPVVNAGNDASSISKSEKSLLGFGQNEVNEPQAQYQTNGNLVKIEALQKEVLSLKILLEEKQERIQELKEHIHTLKNTKFSTQMPLLEAATSLP